MEKRTGIYRRVSSRDQSLASQGPELERWVAAQGEPVEWFEDSFTGRTMARPGLDKLLTELRAGNLARVVVWRLDRLGRTAKGLLELLEEIQVRGVGFVSLREGFDLATPAGRLMFGILASVAAYETEVRGERVRAGIDAAKAKGKRWGGSKAGRLWKVTREKAEAVREMYARGKSKAVIARTVGLSRPTVYAILKGH